MARDIVCPILVGLSSAEARRTGGLGDDAACPRKMGFPLCRVLLMPHKSLRANAPANPAPNACVHLRCCKCGFELRIQPRDHRHLEFLLAHPLEDDLDWMGDDPLLECPTCRSERQGHYPMFRISPEGESNANATE